MKDNTTDKLLDSINEKNKEIHELKVREFLASRRLKRIIAPNDNEKSWAKKYVEILIEELKSFEQQAKG